MNNWMREVDYATYCPKCKSFKVLETDEPCNECLTECDSQAGCVLYIQHKIAKTMEADERKCINEKHV